MASDTNWLRTFIIDADAYVADHLIAVDSDDKVPKVVVAMRDAILAALDRHRHLGLFYSQLV